MLHYFFDGDVVSTIFATQYAVINLHLVTASAVEVFMLAKNVIL